MSPPTPLTPQDGYNSAHQMSFVADLVTYEVDFLQRRLLNSASQTLFNIRRLAFCPLMPMKVKKKNSTSWRLFAANSQVHSIL